VRLRVVAPTREHLVRELDDLLVEAGLRVQPQEGVLGFQRMRVVGRAVAPQLQVSLEDLRRLGQVRVAGQGDGVAALAVDEEYLQRFGVHLAAFLVFDFLLVQVVAEFRKGRVVPPLLNELHPHCPLVGERGGVIAGAILQAEEDRPPHQQEHQQEEPEAPQRLGTDVHRVESVGCRLC
jgi:hypothetical protein